MKTHKGDIEITKGNQSEWKEKLKEVTHITGYLYVYSEAELSAPMLESVGGYLYVGSKAELPKLESVGGDLWVGSKAELPDFPSGCRIGGDIFRWNGSSWRGISKAEFMKHIWKHTDKKGKWSKRTVPEEKRDEKIGMRMAGEML